MSRKGNFLADLDIYYNIYDFDQIENLKQLLTKNVGLEILKVKLNLTSGSHSKIWERILSRYLLGQTMGLNLPEELEKLRFNADFQLENMHHLQSSLSHHQHYIACAYSRKSLCFIGIDIEPQTRKIQPEAYRLFAHHEDDPHAKDNLLQLWVKKEAAFKAIFHWQTSQKCIDRIKGLHQIVIEHNQFYLNQKSSLSLGTLRDLSTTDFYCYLAVIQMPI